MKQHILATTGPPPLNYLEPKWVPTKPMTCLRFTWPIPNIGSFYSTGSSDGKPDHGDGKLHQSRHLPLRQLRPLLRRAARKVRPGNPAAVGGKDISSKRTSMRQLTEGDAQLTAAGPLGACTNNKLGILFLLKRRTIKEIFIKYYNKWGLHSTEVAYLLLTQQLRVQF